MILFSTPKIALKYCLGYSKFNKIGDNNIMSTFSVFVSCFFLMQFVNLTQGY